MKPNYKIHYFNSMFAFTDDYLFLRVISNHEDNQINLVWWHKDDYKNEGTIGQWRIKETKNQ